MPKTFYANETDIPENLKGAYEAKNGRWELTKLDDDHPTIATNKSLTIEQSKLKGQITTLTTEKETIEQERDDFKNKAVPRGFRAVSTEIAELGETVKASGLSKDEIGSLKTKVDEHEREKAETEAKTLKTKAFQSAGVSNVDLALSLRQSDDLNFESETKDGKEVFYRVTEKDGKKEKTLFNADYLKSADGFKDVFDKLTVTKQKLTPFPETGGGETGNIYDKIREQVKTETKTEKVDLGARFGRPETV